MADNKLIGQDYTTPDLVAKVTGKAKYAEDYRVEGMLFAKLLVSTHPHAKVTFDTSAALAMPGVKAILTADDLPDLKGAEHDLDESERAALPPARDEKDEQQGPDERRGVVEEDIPILRVWNASGHARLAVDHELRLAGKAAGKRRKVREDGEIDEAEDEEQEEEENGEGMGAVLARLPQ